MVTRHSDTRGVRRARAVQLVGYWLMVLGACGLVTLFFTLPLPKSASDHSFPQWTYALGRATIVVFGAGLLLSSAPAVRALIRRAHRNS